MEYHNTSNYHKYIMASLKLAKSLNMQMHALSKWATRSMRKKGRNYFLFHNSAASPNMPTVEWVNCNTLNEPVVFLMWLQY